MDVMTMFVIVAMLATVGVLFFGISAMASGGVVGQRSSVEWMAWRVAWQGLAFLFVLLAIYILN